MKLIYAFYALILAAFAGWVMNIVEIINAGFSSDWNGMLIARCIGVFVAPLGAVLGWF
jgi:hypothetical protein